MLVSMQRQARGVVSSVLVSLRQGAIREPGVEPPWSKGPAKFKVQTTRPQIELDFWGGGGGDFWILLKKTSVTSKS